MVTSPDILIYIYIYIDIKFIWTHKIKRFCVVLIKILFMTSDRFHKHVIFLCYPFCCYRQNIKDQTSIYTKRR